MTFVMLILAVFLASTVAVAFDNHDLSCPKPQCSVCEVKKVYKATAKKVPQDSDFLSSTSWGNGDHFQPAFLGPAAEHALLRCFYTFRESDRAPPTLS